MSNFKTLLLATAVGFVGISGGAQAASVISHDTGASTTTHRVVVGPARVVGGKTIASESSIAVGTRKVGHVGGRPYPIEAAHVENSTVHATPTGLVERTEITNTGGNINVNSGGNYYTDTGGSFYADPAWNVNVYTTGAFND